MHVYVLLAIYILREASCIGESINMTIPCRGDPGYQETITVPDFGHVFLHFDNSTDADENTTCEIKLIVTQYKHRRDQYPLQYFMVDLSRIEGLCSYVWIYADSSYYGDPTCKLRNKKTHTITAERLRVVVRYPNTGPRPEQLLITAFYKTTRDCIKDYGLDCCYKAEEYDHLKTNNELGLCDTNRCISSALLCDGTPNCKDRSDEEGTHWCRVWPLAVFLVLAGFVAIVVLVVVKVRRVTSTSEQHVPRLPTMKEIEIQAARDALGEFF